MELSQFIFIIGSLFGLFGFLYKEIKDWRAETREEIASIRGEIKEVRQEVMEQAKRSDRLYEMFIDLLKEQKKPKTNP